MLLKTKGVKELTLPHQNFSSHYFIVWYTFFGGAARPDLIRAFCFGGGF